MAPPYLTCAESREASSPAFGVWGRSSGVTSPSFRRQILVWAYLSSRQRSTLSFVTAPQASSLPSCLTFFFFVFTRTCVSLVQSQPFWAVSLHADLAALVCFNQSGAAELRAKTWLVRVHRLPTKDLSHRGQAPFRQGPSSRQAKLTRSKYSAPPQRRSSPK